MASRVPIRPVLISSPAWASKRIASNTGVSFFIAIDDLDDRNINEHIAQRFASKEKNWCIAARFFD